MVGVRPVEFVISMKIMSLVSLYVVLFTKFMPSVCMVMSSPEFARRKAQIMPGMRNMPRTIESERVFGTSFITDMISIKSDEYVTKP